VKRAAALSPTLRAHCLVYYVILVLAPQALCLRLLRRLCSHNRANRGDSVLHLNVLRLKALVKLVASGESK
jgi:hypothetical protein